MEALFDLNDAERDLQISKQLRLQKIYDTLAFLLAAIGWIWETAQYERYFEDIQYEFIDKHGNPSIDLLDVNEKSSLTVLRALTSAATGLLLYMIYLRYTAEVEIKALLESTEQPISLFIEDAKKHDPKRDIKWRIYPWMFVEFFFLLLHSMPKVNANFETDQQQKYLEYNLDTIMSICIHSRIYLIVRVVRHYSKWTSQNAAAVCKTQNTEASLSFALKALLKEHPAVSVIVLLMSLMGLAGLSERALERPYGVDTAKLANIMNAIWCNFLIITTVGYGDFYPKTHGGRFFAFFACIAGQFFVSITVTTITRMVEFSDPQFKAYYKIRSKIQKDEYQKSAANFIKYAFKYLRRRKGKGITTKARQQLEEVNYQKFATYYKEFEMAKKEIQAEELNLPFEFFLLKCRETFTNKKFYMIRTVRAIDALTQRVKALEENIEYTDKALSSLVEYNSSMLEIFKTVAAKTTRKQPFDELHLNPRALSGFDGLNRMLPPLYYIPKKLPKLDLDLLETFEISNIFDPKKKKRMMKRFELARYAVDPELLKMMDDKVMPKIPFQQKRAIANTKNAKEVLSNILDAKKKQVQSGKARGKYVSGMTLGQTVLDLAAEGKTYSIGAISGHSNEEKDNTSKNSISMASNAGGMWEQERSEDMTSISLSPNIRKSRASAAGKQQQKMFQVYAVGEKKEEEEDANKEGFLQAIKKNKRISWKEEPVSFINPRRKTAQNMPNVQKIQENKEQYSDYIVEDPPKADSSSIITNQSVGISNFDQTSRQGGRPSLNKNDELEHIFEALESPGHKPQESPSHYLKGLNSEKAPQNDSDILTEIQREIQKINPTLNEAKRRKKSSMEEEGSLLRLQPSERSQTSLHHKSLKTEDNQVIMRHLNQESGRSGFNRNPENRHFTTEHDTGKGDSAVMGFKEALENLILTTAKQQEGNDSTGHRSRNPSIMRNIPPFTRQGTVHSTLNKFEAESAILSVPRQINEEQADKEYTTLEIKKEYYDDYKPKSVSKLFKDARAINNISLGKPSYTEVAPASQSKYHGRGGINLNRHASQGEIEYPSEGNKGLENFGVKQGLYTAGRSLARTNTDIYFKDLSPKK